MGDFGDDVGVGFHVAGTACLKLDQRGLVVGEKGEDDIPACPGPFCVPFERRTANAIDTGALRA